MKYYTEKNPIIVGLISTNKLFFDEEQDKTDRYFDFLVLLNEKLFSKVKYLFGNNNNHIDLLMKEIGRLKNNPYEIETINCPFKVLQKEKQRYIVNELVMNSDCIIYFCEDFNNPNGNPFGGITQDLCFDRSSYEKSKPFIYIPMELEDIEELVRVVEEKYFKGFEDDWLRWKNNEPPVVNPTFRRTIESFM
jgi:hypothetical protein|tara:strand:+ start:69 stop:644 length:576 start_codon:yes stop_codon:yes gene_type:complete